MTSTSALGLLTGLGLGLGLWMLASLAPRMNRPRLTRRIAPYLVDISSAAREAVAPPVPGPLPVLGVLTQPLAARTRALLSVVLGGNDQVARRLRQAGSPLSVDGFRAKQLLWGIAGAVLGLVLGGVAVGTKSAALPFGVLIVTVAGAVGVIARDYLLQRAARRRLDRLVAELPVVLEFLTLSLSAGEGILDAIRRVARVGGGELSGELAGVVAAVSTGLPFAETLSQLERDLDLAPLSRCIEQIVGALERGTPIVEVLRAQAQDARDDAKRSLIEVAGRKEIAMLFPLVFLILPITICFAIFPGIVVLQLGL